MKPQAEKMVFADRIRIRNSAHDQERLELLELVTRERELGWEWFISKKRKEQQ